MYVVFMTLIGLRWIQGIVFCFSRFVVFVERTFGVVTQAYLWMRQTFGFIGFVKKKTAYGGGRRENFAK